MTVLTDERQFFTVPEVVAAFATLTKESSGGVAAGFAPEDALGLVPFLKSDEYVTFGQALIAERVRRDGNDLPLVSLARAVGVARVASSLWQIHRDDESPENRVVFVADGVFAEFTVSETGFLLHTGSLVSFAQRCSEFAVNLGSANVFYLDMSWRGEQVGVAWLHGRARHLEQGIWTDAGDVPRDTLNGWIASVVNRLVLAIDLPSQAPPI